MRRFFLLLHPLLQGRETIRQTYLTIEPGQQVIAGQRHEHKEDGKENGLAIGVVTDMQPLRGLTAPQSYCEQGRYGEKADSRISDAKIKKKY